MTVFKHFLSALMLLGLMATANGFADDAAPPQPPIQISQPAPSGDVSGDRTKLREERHRLHRDRAKLRQDRKEQGKDSAQVKSDREQVKKDREAVREEKQKLQGEVKSGQ